MKNKEELKISGKFVDWDNKKLNKYKKEEELKEEIENTCKKIVDVELAGYENNEDKKFYRKSQKRKLYLKAKLIGFQAGKQEALKEFEGDLLRKDNHILGCMLEGIENVLRYRGLNKEADMLMDVASRIK